MCMVIICGRFGGVISCIFDYWSLQTIVGVLEAHYLYFSILDVINGCGRFGGALVVFFNIGHYKWLWAFGRCHYLAVFLNIGHYKWFWAFWRCH